MQLLTRSQKNYIIENATKDLDSSESDKARLFLHNLLDTVMSMNTCETAIAETWHVEDLRMSFEEQTDGLTDDQLLQVLENYSQRDKDNDFDLLGCYLSEYIADLEERSKEVGE